MVAANVWSIVHLDVDVTKLVAVEMFLSVPAALITRIRRGERKRLEEFINRGVNALLSREFIAAGWAVFLGIASFISAAIITGSGATSVCIARQASGPCRSTGAAGQDSARLLLPTTPFSRRYVLREGTTVLFPFRHFPFVPTRLNLDEDLGRRILLRIQYPLADIGGGRIELRDERGRCLAFADMAGGSAAMIVGTPFVHFDKLMERWRTDLAGYSDAEIAAAISAWQKPIPARSCAGGTVDIAKIGTFVAVFRTAKQLDPGATDTRASATVPDDEGLQDILLMRSTR